MTSVKLKQSWLALPSLRHHKSQLCSSLFTVHPSHAAFVQMLVDFDGMHILSFLQFVVRVLQQWKLSYLPVPGLDFLGFKIRFSSSLEGTSCHLFKFCGFRLMTFSPAIQMVSKHISIPQKVMLLSVVCLAEVPGLQLISSALRWWYLYCKQVEW